MHPKALANLRVLIVERDADMRLYVRTCLQRVHVERIRIVEAEDGERALDALADIANVDLVIAGVRAPGHDGVAMVERLRDLAPWKTLPVLLISGDADLVALTRRRMYGDAHMMVMEKPFNATALVEVVEELLRGE